MGGQADAIASELRRNFTPGASLHDGLHAAVSALGSAGGSDGKPRELPTNQLEVAVLDRTRGKRKFRRLTGAALTQLLPPGEAPGSAPAVPPEVADEIDPDDLP
jgi:proteasome alpha subunit